MPRFSRFIRALVVLIATGAISMAVWLVGRSLWATWHFQQAEASIARRDLKSARQFLEVCLRERPGSAEVHFLAARTARRAGDLDEAQRLLDRTRELGWVDNQLDLEAALLNIQRGRSPGLMGRLMDFLRREHPDTPIIAEIVVPAALEQFDLMRAEEAAVFWSKADRNDPRPLLARGDVHERLRNRAEAIQHYRDALTIDPGSTQARLRLGFLLLDQSQPAEALEHFSSLVRTGDSSIAVRRGMARCHLELGRSDALEMIDAILNESPNDGELLTCRGRIQLDAGRAVEALADLSRAAEQPPVDGATWHQLARCFDQLQRPVDAARVRERIRREEEGQKQAAIHLREIASHPDDPKPRCELAKILAANGLAAEAERWLRSALGVDPRYEPAIRELEKLRPRR